MTSVFVRFAPSYDPRSPRDHMVERFDQAGTVVVRENHKRAIGRAREIKVLPDPLGRLWWHALVDVDDPPDWLKVGGAVSWGAAEGGRRRDMGVDIITRAFLHEISLLDPTRVPADRQARVITITDAPDPAVIRRGIGRVLGVR